MRHPEYPTLEDLEKIRKIVNESESPLAYLALVGDKKILFSETGRSFLMYENYGKSWVALNVPVGPRAEWDGLFHHFYKISDEARGWPVFFNVSRREVARYLNLGLSCLKIGEEALVPLDRFSLQGKINEDFRYTLRRLDKEGCSFEIIPPDQSTAILPRLRAISEEWLLKKTTREKRFCLGSFKEEYLRLTSIAVVRRAGHIVAFSNFWVHEDLGRVSIDMMRYGSSVPRRVMDYLFINMMLWGKRNGFRELSMGLAPLAGLGGDKSGSFWDRIGSLIFRCSEKLYNFKGLRRYKQKFRPVWEPRYLASPSGWTLFRTFADIAVMTSGGLRGLLSK